MSFTIQTEIGEVLITNENFSDYFYDVRTNRPKKGQVMAKFTAVAEFVDGRGKQDILQLLKTNKAHAAVQVMRKIHGVREPDCYRVLREIAQDMLTMPEAEVEKKPYEMVIELFFYTQRQYVPNSPNWELLPLLNYDKETGTYKSSIEL